jgi:hypothetical protein
LKISELYIKGVLPSLKKRTNLNLYLEISTKKSHLFPDIILFLEITAQKLHLFPDIALYLEISMEVVDKKKQWIHRFVPYFNPRQTGADKAGLR